MRGVWAPRINLTFRYIKCHTKGRACCGAPMSTTPNFVCAFPHTLTVPSSRIAVESASRATQLIPPTRPDVMHEVSAHHDISSVTSSRQLPVALTTSAHHARGNVSRTKPLVITLFFLIHSITLIFDSRLTSLTSAVTMTVRTPTYVIQTLTSLLKCMLGPPTLLPTPAQD